MVVERLGGKTPSGVLSPAAGWRSGASVMEPITACKSLELLYDVFGFVGDVLALSIKIKDANE